MATSHKRTSSAAGNINGTPEVKRQMTPNNRLSSTTDLSEPEYVYIVVQDSGFGCPESTVDIIAVYSTIKDANNAVIDIVNDYGDTEDCSHGYEDDGRLYWRSLDIGEGERMEVRIHVEDVKGPGFEPEREKGPNFGILEKGREVGSVGRDFYDDEDDGENQNHALRRRKDKDTLHWAVRADF